MNRGTARPFEVSAERYGSTAWLGLAGDLTAESHDQALRAMASALAPGSRAVVLDLAHVRRLDCSGIGLLLLLRRQVLGRGGMVVLAQVERRQRRMLALAGLDAAFRMFANSVAAIVWCESVATVQTAALGRTSAPCRVPAWRAPDASTSLAVAAHSA